MNQGMPVDPQGQFMDALGQSANPLTRELMAAMTRSPYLDSQGGQQVARAELVLRSGFLGFQGHFPGYPILPAVVQLLLGRILAQVLQGEPLCLVRVQRAKFMREVLPDMTVAASCTRRKGMFYVEIIAQGELAASFQLGPAPEAA